MQALLALAPAQATDSLAAQLERVLGVAQTVQRMPNQREVISALPRNMRGCEAPSLPGAALTTRDWRAAHVVGAVALHVLCGREPWDWLGASEDAETMQARMHVFDCARVHGAEYVYQPTVAADVRLQCHSVAYALFHVLHGCLSLRAEERLSVEDAVATLNQLRHAVSARMSCSTPQLYESAMNVCAHRLAPVSVAADAVRPSLVLVAAAALELASLQDGVDGTSVLQALLRVRKLARSATVCAALVRSSTFFPEVLGACVATAVQRVQLVHHAEPVASEARNDALVLLFNVLSYTKAVVLSVQEQFHVACEEDEAALATWTTALALRYGAACWHAAGTALTWAHDMCTTCVAEDESAQADALADSVLMTTSCALSCVLSTLASRAAVAGSCTPMTLTILVEWLRAEMETLAPEQHEAEILPLCTHILAVFMYGAQRLTHAWSPQRAVKAVPKRVCEALVRAGVSSTPLLVHARRHTEDGRRCARLLAGLTVYCVQHAAGAGAWAADAVDNVAIVRTVHALADAVENAAALLAAPMDVVDQARERTTMLMCVHALNAAFMPSHKAVVFDGKPEMHAAAQAWLAMALHASPSASASALAAAHADTMSNAANVSALLDIIRYALALPVRLYRRDVMLLSWMVQWAHRLGDTAAAAVKQWGATVHEKLADDLHVAIALLRAAQTRGAPASSGDSDSSSSMAAHETRAQRLLRCAMAFCVCAGVLDVRRLLALAGHAVLALTGSHADELWNHMVRTNAGYDALRTYVLSEVLSCEPIPRNAAVVPTATTVGMCVVLEQHLGHMHVLRLLGIDVNDAATRARVLRAVSAVVDDVLAVMLNQCSLLDAAQRFTVADKLDVWLQQQGLAAAELAPNAAATATAEPAATAPTEPAATAPTESAVAAAQAQLATESTAFVGARDVGADAVTGDTAAVHAPPHQRRRITREQRTWLGRLNKDSSDLIREVDVGRARGLDDDRETLAATVVGDGCGVTDRMTLLMQCTLRMALLVLSDCVEACETMRARTSATTAFALQPWFAEAGVFQRLCALMDVIVAVSWTRCAMGCDIMAAVVELMSHVPFAPAIHGVADVSSNRETLLVQHVQCMAPKAVRHGTAAFLRPSEVAGVGSKALLRKWWWCLSLQSCSSRQRAVDALVASHPDVLPRTLAAVRETVACEPGAGLLCLQLRCLSALARSDVPHRDALAAALSRSGLMAALITYVWRFKKTMALRAQCSVARDHLIAMATAVLEIVAAMQTLQRVCSGQHVATVCAVTRQLVAVRDVTDELSHRALRALPACVTEDARAEECAVLRRVYNSRKSASLSSRGCV